MDRSGCEMLMVKIAIGLLACVLSAILYRAGGQSKDIDAKPTWMPMWLRKSWVRDWLLPALFLFTVFLFWRPSSLLDWVLLLPYYGLSGGALSTYWDDSKNKLLDWIAQKINWIYPADNHYLHGFFCGVAGFCLITFVPWWILTIRLIVCPVGMGLWSKWQGTDWKEEEGRGALFVL